MERATILFDDASQLASPGNVVPGFIPEVPPTGLAFGKELSRWHWPGMFVERAYRTVERAAASNPSKGKEKGEPLSTRGGKPGEMAGGVARPSGSDHFQELRVIPPSPYVAEVPKVFNVEVVAAGTILA